MESNGPSMLHTSTRPNGSDGVDERSRLTHEARYSYQLNDVEASRLVHEQMLEARQNGLKEEHAAVGDYVKSMIFGGLDGILTTFAIVAGAAGGRLPVQVVLVLGFSGIFANAVSMGMGEYLSSKAEADYIMRERGREAWEYDVNQSGEEREMIDIYISKGMTREDAETVITTMAKYKELFIDVMMVDELGLKVPDARADPIKEGIIMFLAFAAFGAMPLLGYTIVPFLFPTLAVHILFTIACIVTGLTLFVMGVVQSKFTFKKWYKAGFETLLLGGVCAFLAYEIGHLVSRLLGIDP